MFLLLPVRANAAGGTGSARLTGYAPLYLPSIVNITVQASPNSFGSVSGGAAGVAPGENVTVTATPNQGYYFSGWFEDGRLVSDSEAYTFQAERDRNLIAHFSDRETNNNQANAETSADAGDSGDEENANAENSENSGGDANQEQNPEGSNQEQSAGIAESMQDGNPPQNQGDGGAAGGSDGQGTAGGPGTPEGGGQDAANAGGGSAGGAQSGGIVPYVPVAPAANAADMPTTGTELYRVPMIVVLVLFGVIAVLISIPLKGRKRL